jgi:plastocyanin
MNMRFGSATIAGALAVCIAGAGVSRAGSRAGAPLPPASGAVVKGVVKIQGAVPKPVPIDMSADPKCVQAHPGGALTNDVMADSSGGLQDVIVYVSQGLGDAKFEPPTESAVIEQKGCMYKPHVVAVRANQELKVVNSDPTTHNIHPSPNNNRELNQTQPPGVPFSMTFAREEIAIPVKCNIHPWMRSSIAVFKHPFFAVTGKDGSFEIGNLPPGSYTITAWHEKFGTSFQKITVGESETKTLEFVFKAQAGS